MATIMGTGGYDTLIGTPEDDIINGWFRSDRLEGGEGNDSLLGEHGNDTLIAGEGDDTLLGGDGDDIMQGGPGADAMDGGSGFDLLDYSTAAAPVTLDMAAGSAAGADATGDIFANVEGVIGTAFADLLRGDAGDNRIEGGAGADTLEGGDGIDLLSFLGSDAALRADLSAGTVAGGHAEGDIFSGFEGLGGSAFGDVLTGDAGNNLLGGALGEDTISGGAGDDFINGGGGDDTLTGGAGADRFYYSSNFRDRRSPDQGTDTILDYSDAEGDVLILDTDLFRSELVITRAHHTDAAGAALGDPDIMDVMIGLTGRERADAWILADGAGLERIFIRKLGGATVDLLTLGTVVGTAGDDMLRPDAFTGFGVYEDTLLGLDGNDTLWNGQGYDILDGGAGDDTFIVSEIGVARFEVIGGDGQDLIEFAGRWRSLEFDLATGEMGSPRQVSVSGVEHVNGHENAEILRGNDAANRLHGRGGDDRLWGRAGDDSLFGGDGYDRIWGDAGADLIDGGDGVDQLDYYASPAAVTVDLAAGTGIGGDAEGDTILHIENVVGSGFADRISGDAADNRIEGGAGADTLSGGDGTLDFLVYSRSGSAVTVDLGAGTASGGHAEGDVISGFEAIAGSSHDDFLYGDDGDNAIGGGEGSDFISGGAGNDFLNGGKGFGSDLAEDTLTGGDGADRFFGGTRVFDIVLDYSDTEGDVLVFARRPSRGSEFVATVGHFQDASGAALGDDAVMDVRISLEGGTTGDFWILADGAELEHIFMRSMGGPTFDLLEG